MSYLEYFHEKMVKLHSEDTDFYRADPVEDIQLSYEEETGDHVPAKYRLTGLDAIRENRIAEAKKLEQQNREFQRQASKRKAEEEENRRPIEIQVGGKTYEASREDNGRLRFVKNPDHFLIKRMSPIFGGEGNEDPNSMAIAYAKGEFSLRDYAEMNIAMGYSIDGFEELHAFEELEIRCDIPALCRNGRHFTAEDDQATVLV